MTNTIKVKSAGVPALSFIINQLGEKVGQKWAEGGALDVHAMAQIETREYNLYFDAGGVLDLTKWLALHQERKAAYAAHNAACNALEVKRAELIGARPEPLAMSFKTAGGVYEVFTSPPNAGPIDGALMPADIKAIYEAWESGAGVTGTFKGPFVKSDGRPCPIPNIESQYNYFKAYNAFDIEHNVQAQNIENFALWQALWNADLCVCFAPANNLNDLSLKAGIVAAVCDPEIGDCGHERAILNGMTRDITRLAIKQLKDFRDSIEGAE